jgi:hypothetical protein
VEVGQGRVVRAGLTQRQSHEPANQQVGREQLLQRGVGAGISPGTDHLSTDELGNGKGGRGTRSARSVMEAGTGGNHGSRVIPSGKQHQGVVGAAAQQRAIDQGFEPAENGSEKFADQPLHGGRDIRQVASAGPQHGWYNRHTNRLSVT